MGKIVLERRPIDLAGVGARSLATFQSAGRFGAHRLERSLDPVWVDADETRMEQIVANLVGNALKFTPAGGTVGVSVRRIGDDALLEVRDSGVGMSEELRARVFELFVQGDSALDRGKGGLGIGLTLVRRLAELHGGTASAASAGAGKGASFTVRVPAIEPPATKRAPVRPRPPPRAGGPRPPLCRRPRESISASRAGRARGSPAASAAR